MRLRRQKANNKEIINKKNHVLFETSFDFYSVNDQVHENTSCDENCGGRVMFQIHETILKKAAKSSNILRIIKMY